MKKFQNLKNKIFKLAEDINRPINLMEVCGTHTQTISKFGIRQFLPKNVNLITGPGCPVCVTDQSDINNIVALALAGIPIASYGDAIRVPGDNGSLEDAGAKGAKVFTVYSIDEVFELKKNNPDIVFFGLGFETTTPMTAYAIQNGITTYSTHKLFLPAMKALLKMGEINIDGFINPGHVSVIIGAEKFCSIDAPQVITGFEAEDVLASVYLLLKQIKEGRKEVENEYIRAVTKHGNKKAYDLIFQVFEKDIGIWRGLGAIPGSGLKIKNRYSILDAKVKHKNILKNVKNYKPKINACKCGDIIKGLIKPQNCPMFKKTCSPDKPFGPCMVSTEGACNVEFEYN